MEGPQAWRGSCKDYQVPNAEKTGLWGGTEVTAQMSSSHNANLSVLHLGVLLQRVSESEVRVLSVLGWSRLSDIPLPSLLLMLQSPGYYVFLKQPPSPACLLMGLLIHV